MSFLQAHFNIVDDGGEVAVCCPFPHHTNSGIPYLENNPSAHVNTTEGLFHCKACGASGNELSIIQDILGCNYAEAKKIMHAFESGESLQEWQNETLSETSKKRALDLGISEEVIEDLQLKTPAHTDSIAFPVFMDDVLLDIRTYNPGGEVKIKSRSGCPNGLIIPFDTWQRTPTNRATIICAGEKDMAIARSKGLNAITITGGENKIPSQLNYFKDRIVIIVYDNDQTGRAGAIKLANALLEVTDKVKVVTKFHEGMEEKEDITDYFVKYEHTKEELIASIEETDWHTLTDIKKDFYPQKSLLEASQPQNIGKMIQSNVQIVAISEQTFTCPEYLVMEKFKQDKNDTMALNEIREWQLTDKNSQDILHMIDNNFKEVQITANIKDLLKIPQKEKYVSMKTIKRMTVFKCTLTDMFETVNTNTGQPMEYTAYSINTKLESGQKYMVSYKLAPHPYKGQQLVMLITEAQQANDSVTNFQLTPEVKQSLDIIKNIEGNLTTKIETLTEKVKGLLGYDGINNLIKAIDFAYHTPLQFNFGNFKNERAYLDIIVVGESRTGKSSTADTLRKTYQLGTFTSLAGNSATIPGLVGGSAKTASGQQTRAGTIPQNHKGLIVFEEFGKSNASIITELTDIRSSNEVRITRVSGTITLPAMVRMIALTNPKNKNGKIQSIESYPDGISILTELVETAEDIARYDMIVIIPDKGNTQINPLWKPEKPLPEKVYQNRIRWVWSRKPEQIVIDEETELHIVQKANQLNKSYEGHIKIFGTEAWKKISRLAIAIAGYVCSTDSTYENIVVTKEHVDYAIAFLISLYDNDTFKLKEFINNERLYTRTDQDAIAALQNLYEKNPTLIMQLERCATISKNVLMAATGMEQADLNKALNTMTKMLFIRFNNHEIMPTERFRKSLTQLNRQTAPQKLGEANAEIQMDIADNNY